MTKENLQENDKENKKKQRGRPKGSTKKLEKSLTVEDVKEIIKCCAENGVHSFQQDSLKIDFNSEILQNKAITKDLPHKDSDTLDDSELEEMEQAEQLDQLRLNSPEEYEKLMLDRG